MNFQKKLMIKRLECWRFIHYVARHFIEDDCPYRASALAFTTLLAIVPLMSILLTILSKIPVFQNLGAPLQDFIFANFVPTTGKLIQDYLEIFSSQVSRLSIIGVVFLFVIAFLVMFTIESAMNKIWRISASRKGLSAFLLYWAIVSLAPFLLGLSLAMSSYLLSHPFFIAFNIPVVLHLIPFFCSLAGFTFLYVVVPNCPVKFLHGLCGAAFAAILFELAKLAFADFFSYYNMYQILYGAFAAIPLFFMWIYWVWFITLLGAEISYALSMHHQRRTGMPLDGFSHALLWLYHLRQAQIEGGGLTIQELINSCTHAYATDVGKMLKELTNLLLIKSTQDDHYILSRDLSQFTLYDLSQLLPYRLPDFSLLTNDALPKKWQTEIQEMAQHMRKTFKISLESLFRNH